MSDKKTMATVVPVAVANRFKAACAIQGRRIKDVLAEIIAKWAKDNAGLDE